VDEALLLDGFVLDDLLADDLLVVLLADDLLVVLLAEVFLEVVFELEDFGLLLELFDFTFAFELDAFGVEDFFAVDCFAGFGLDFGFAFVCANEKDCDKGFHGMTLYGRMVL